MTTRQQRKRQVLSDISMHREWLKQNVIVEYDLSMSEAAYTGLILASLLDPSVSSSVYAALIAGAGGRASARKVDPIRAYAPTRGVDLVVQGGRSDLAIVEHKRFDSNPHAPGYKSNPDAPWQTDKVWFEYDKYRKAPSRVDPPRWLGGLYAECPRFVVLDTYGREMEEIFPGGECNEEYIVTSYAQFAKELRSAYDCSGVSGLKPLLSALYSWNR